MVNGALLRQVETYRYPIEGLPYLLRDLEIPSERLGARFLDLGGDRSQVRTYLHELQRSFIFAISTAFISMIIVVLVALDFSSLGGASLLAPVMAIFLGLMAFFMAIVALYSCIVSLKYLKQTVRAICPN